jgi:hypothetical protein
MRRSYGWWRASGRRQLDRRQGPATESKAKEPMQAAGGATDEYLTSLSFERRGRGLVVHHRGSDMAPWGVSATESNALRLAIEIDPADGPLPLLR